MEPKMVKISELQLADVVRLGEYPYSYATVEQIKDGIVHLIRPYIHTADFSCTSGVITYIGHEHVKHFQNSENTVILLERKELK